MVSPNAHKDNSLIKVALTERGQGRVLVVDGGASLRRALLGGMNAELATKNGWAGIIINGCVRDLDELSRCVLGIKALGNIPLATQKRNEGERDIPIQIQNIWIRPHEYIYADQDGIIVSDRNFFSQKNII